MIFLTVGTIMPFDRLVRAVDDWAESRGRSDVFGQIGDLQKDSYRPGFDWTERLTPSEFRTRLADADLVIAHAGIGSIVEALSHARPILIMPRRHDLREHVNDHQLETVRRFASRDGVTVAMDPDEIAPALDAFVGGTAAPPTLGPDADESLIAAIRDTIHGKGPARR